MPELPEVEVICRHLNKNLQGRIIDKVDIYLPRMVRNTDANNLLKLVNDEFKSVRRRGKYIVVESKQGRVLLIHLRMTGRLIYHPKNSSVEERYERIRFSFTDGTYLTYGDTRTLGAVYYFDTYEDIDIKGFLTLGVEPLTSDFSAEVLYELTRKSKSNLKAFLLNQKYVVGLGNIYVDEALFESHIRPNRATNSLTKEECKKLYDAIVAMLSASITRGGTTFRDYKNGEGEQGNNQNYLAVYGRGKKNCMVCNHQLSSERIAGRTTVYCEECQK